MANVTISDFPSQSAMTDSTIIPTVYSGLNYQISGANLLPYMQANIPGANIVGAVANAAYSNTSGIAYSVDGANVNGAVANATLAINAVNAANADFATTAGSANSVSGSNVSGTVANAAYANTAGVANLVALANVTGAGNIASININGNSSQVLAGNGAWITPASGYSNANVAAYLPNNSSNVSGNNFTARGDVNVGAIGSPAAVVSVFASTPTKVTLEGMETIPFSVSNGDTIIITGATGPQSSINGTWVVSNVAIPFYDINCTAQPPVEYTPGAQLQVITGGDVTAVGNVTASNFIGNIDLSYVVGLGNIAELNLNGNSAQVLAGDGTWISSGGGNSTPGGSNTQVQFNDSGAFGGSANFTFDGNVVSATDLAATVLQAGDANTVGESYLTVDANGVSLGETGSQFVTVNANGIVLGSTAGVYLRGGAGAPVNIGTNPSPVTIGNSAGYTVNIEAPTTNITSSNINLGDVVNVHVTGGSAGEVLTTDGAGNLSWTATYGNANVETLLASGNITTDIITTSNVIGQVLQCDAGTANVGAMVAVPGIKGAPNQLLIASAEGPADGLPGIDFTIRGGNANIDVGGPAKGGDVVLQAGFSTNGANGLVRINNGGGRILLGGTSDTIEINSPVQAVSGMSVNNTLTVDSANIQQWSYVPQLWFKGMLSTNQNLTTGVDTILLYDNNTDPQLWGNTASTTGQIVPNKAGWYEIISRVEFGAIAGNAQAQLNHQISVNGAQVSITQIPNNTVVGSGTGMVGTAFVELNGTTDYITTQCYTTVAGQQCIGLNSTLLLVKWIST